VALAEFNKNPSRDNLPALKSIPALYKALQYQYSEQDHLADFAEADDMVGVCWWLEKRAKEVLASLIRHQADPPDGFHRPENDWQKVRSQSFMK